MRAPLLVLVCLSSAFTCRSDALGHERSFEPEARGALEVIDWSALSASAPQTGPWPLTNTAGSRLNDPASIVARSQVPAEPQRSEPAAKTPSEAAARSVHYALARHLERAEQRRGRAQLFDFGAPGDAKYTFGGWLGHHSTRELHEFRSTLRVRASNLKLVLPADDAALSQLTLAVRSFGPARLSVHLNGQTKAVGTVELAGHGLQTTSLALPAGLLQRGDNRVELRLYSQGPATEPGFALDYAALSDEAPVGEALAPTSHAQLRPQAGRDRLFVPAGLTLAYTFEAPEQASWTAGVRSDEKAELEVRVARDGAAPQLLGSIETSTAEARTDFDLSAYAGQAIRLELRAQGAAVSLDEPVITRASERSQAPARAPIRNVLLYLIDTLRADKLSPYNAHTRVRTPGLSRFLEGAAVLTSARSQENWTKPSVATLLSSLLPWEHNTFGDAAVLPDSVRILPEYLQAQGFFTGGFIANGYVSDKFGFKKGFDTYRNYIREGRRSVAQSVASDVLQWLDERPKDKPFFLYVHTIDAHVPYQPPHDYLELYDRESYSGPVSFAKDSLLLEHIKLGRLPLAVRDKERLQALYDGAISYHDVYFNVIMNALEQRGLSGDTLVVVTADHGEEFWDHGSVGHGHSLFDELLHVPLLLRVPGVTQAGDRVRSNVGLVDVAPTILDALDVAAPDSLSGRSFLPELLGGSADAPRTSVSGFMTGLRSLAVGRYKLVQRGLTQSALYDTASDPQETRDISEGSPIALGYARGLLGLALAHEHESDAATRTPAVHAARQTQIDPDTERQLRALGYVSSSHP